MHATNQRMPNPCQDEQDKVDNMKADLEDLQAQIQAASSPSEKMGLIRQIDKQTARLDSATAMLEACQRAHRLSVSVEWTPLVQVSLVLPAGNPLRRNSISVAERFTLLLRFSEEPSIFSFDEAVVEGSTESKIGTNTLILRHQLRLRPAQTGDVSAPFDNQFFLGLREMSILTHVDISVEGSTGLPPPLPSRVWLRAVGDIGVATDGVFQDPSDPGQTEEGSVLDARGYLEMVGTDTITLQGDVGVALPDTARFNVRMSGFSNADPRNGKPWKIDLRRP
jgi:hypothetical protein